ncbi:PD-(D/E)XK nuclease-like domain-containing protein [Methylocucumis oryzae]|uniref:Putative exodeoxyribonuclease 8 PDDEXK-like domain-containing protein n=1 Tax=Methylocucumis oryzae TaxID=1632867 RepID=A0A0F3IMN9_9GAMM|nr:PD-(D/E)XK nuclease-like domain-containing protein [Methylocucumis oryzae]KJV08005.1 hypothetical protein VZ94_00885 [Methylocucumis oryzae]
MWIDNTDPFGFGELTEEPEELIPPESLITRGLLSIEECLEAGAKGVDIPNEVYHALPGISGSNLPLLAESNKHLDNKHLFAMSSPSLQLGSLVHTMVLEPHDVFNRYVVMPRFEGKAKTGMSVANAESIFKQEHRQKAIIDAEEFKKAERMATNVTAICGDIINQGIKERSLFAKVEGLILKCRLDIDLEDVGDDYDLKTIALGQKEFSNATIRSHIIKYRYHWSAALRNAVRRELGKDVRDSYLIFVSSTPPNMVRVIKIDPAWIEQAELEVQDLLDNRRFYLQSGSDNTEITTIGNKYE